MRFFLFFVLLTVCLYYLADAQDDTLTIKKAGSYPASFYKVIADSASLAKIKHQQFIEDSLSMLYLMPDSKRESQLLSKILKAGLLDFPYYSSARSGSKNLLKTGQIRKTREPWIINTIIGLLLYTALLNLSFNKEIKGVWQSLYNKNVLTQLDKEGAGINFGAFIGLFLLFCLAFGLVLYHVVSYENIYFEIGGFRLFIYISIGVSIILSLKFLLLKFIGVVFDINRLVSQYINIINLTYFNISFLLLSVGICFSLFSRQFVPALITITLIIFILIFAWQYLRNSVSVIFNFRFHKFYLFIYLCALEICPILILIKVLNK